MTKSSRVSHILNLIKENNIKFVDFRFTDYRAKWLHISHCADAIGEEELTKGVAFDGSSVPAWKEINESDMILMPDHETAVMDPFTQHPTLILRCDIHDPYTHRPYLRDPRAVAKRAEEYLR